MNNSRINAKKRLCVISMFIYITLTLLPIPTGAFSDQVIQRGATGDDVVELQARLQYIGFYDEQIDGVFGWSTYWAVRNYQSEFGMDVDGLVGDQTKSMLERSTQFHKEFVHKALREGRKFTHYGTTPLDIQKGPKGSRDSGKKQQESGSQEGQVEQGETVPEEGQQQSTEQQQPDTGGPQEQSPTPGAWEQPSPEQGMESPDTGQVTEPTPQQEGGEGVETPTDEPIVPGEETDDANIQSAINVPQGFSENDIQIMAQAVYGEARGEPYVGQVAVAAVILNRMRSPIFPNTASGVIFEPRAFTAVADGQIYLEPNETARKAVLDAINGQDPSGNALYYFNPDTATSGWIWTRPQIKKIGKHIFCK